MRSVPLGRSIDSCGVSLGIAEAIRRCHDAGLVHRDIRPVNVFVDIPSERAWLSGFANAVAWRAEDSMPAAEGPGTLALSHASPEVGGRIGHGADCRSDLYSFGVLLYQMLTGRLPFVATERRELIHAHLAIPPVAPTHIVADLPPALEGIVLRLLSKAAADRHQSAAELEAELRQCLHVWLSNGHLAAFNLTATEGHARPRVPEHLYGRADELKALQACLQKAATQDRAKMVLLSGFSGIGKSALVAEFHRALPAHSGFFASGKSDQSQSAVPHATLAQALRALLRPLLTLPPDQREAWRRRLEEAVLANGQIIANMAPDLVELLGPQPALASLSPRDHQLQFHTTLRRFSETLRVGARPLILFLDDLQWTDSATLAFIDHALLAEPDGHLLLIGAYRSDEIGSNRSLAAWLQRMRDRSADVDDICLAPLSAEEIGNLVGDTLVCATQACVDVTQLVYG